MNFNIITNKNIRLCKIIKLFKLLDLDFSKLNPVTFCSRDFSLFKNHCNL
jgi:flagellar biosynthesis protein FlhB